MWRTQNYAIPHAFSLPADTGGGEGFWAGREGYRLATYTHLRCGRARTHRLTHTACRRESAFFHLRVDTYGLWRSPALACRLLATIPDNGQIQHFCASRGRAYCTPPHRWRLRRAAPQACRTPAPPLRRLMRSLPLLLPAEKASGCCSARRCAMPFWPSRRLTAALYLIAYNAYILLYRAFFLWNNKLPSGVPSLFGRYLNDGLLPYRHRLGYLCMNVADSGWRRTFLSATSGLASPYRNNSSVQMYTRSGRWTCPYLQPPY